MLSLTSFQLTAKLTNTGSSVTVSNDIFSDTALSFTGETILLTSDDGSIKELMVCTAAAGTLTITQRGLDQSAIKTTDNDLRKEWRAGTVGRVVNAASDLVDKDTGLLHVFADATARDAAITSPSNGMQCYLTSEGTFSDYVGGAWTNRASGTVVNASTTVAGKVEIATSAETQAGTDTGGTGAENIAPPSDIAANEQSGTFVYAADAEASDTYVIALTPALTAYTTGQRIRFKANTVNTGACTINVNALGAKSIKTTAGDDPSNGDIAASELVELVYDGTNFVLQKAPKAGTAREGVVELATDAEVITGTDETRYVNAKQVTDKTVIAHGSTTYDLSTASGTQNIAHGMGLTPRFAKFYYFITASDVTVFQGITDGTTPKGITRGGDGTIAIDTTNTIGYDTSGGNGQDAVVTIDGTNLILTRTKTGSPTGTLQIIWEAHV